MCSAKEEGIERENKEKRKDKMKNCIPSDNRIGTKDVKFWFRKKCYKTAEKLPRIAWTDPFGEGIVISTCFYLVMKASSTVILRHEFDVGRKSISRPSINILSENGMGDGIVNLRSAGSEFSMLAPDERKKSHDLCLQSLFPYTS